ncbi:GH92 family glycosyl hydrolase [Salegentibacter sp. LM13S]|uniref:GH92 family glycosyl hydrolase n=1 Tax=Salegentibacter lacus TaxID=2873599 RepID=UPI001CCB9E67|nr:GH92 family glycosyl hydrolase [Salegentibacter lacus]MBZ9632388.1 GH92 family glycosyl hydrolase [Salegentibacter lacus]
MFRKYPILLFVLVITIAACKERNKKEINDQDSNRELTSYVDPFIGTGGHGHTYPGATVPFGMIQLSPDNGISDWDWCSGYHISDNIIAGFSHLHLSGTGIGDLADLLFMPVNREIDLTTEVRSREDIPYKSKFSHENEESKPGYYQVFLDDHQINVELTSSLRTGYSKYTFTEADTQSVVLDLGFAINWDSPTETKIVIENGKTISGYRHSKGWAKNQKVFFTAEFSKPIISHSLFTEGKKIEGKTAEGTKTSAQFFFDEATGREVQVKLALSSVSIKNAKENLDKQKFQFKEVKEEGNSVWENSLENITIQTPVDSLKTIFYTALYHTQLAPVTFSDKNGEFRKENDSLITAEDYTAYSTLSLWDTFRAQQPLLTITHPDRVSDIINSMLEYYKTNKILPVWTLYGNETNTMTGYHSIPVITEAYLKGIRGFDVEEAYAAMKNTMMQDERGLEYYKEYGYIPFELLDESVTITLEYAYNDWCVAQMAKALGKDKDYEYFSARAKAYKKLFDVETGFMRGKSKDGETWNSPFDPKFSNHRENTDYTEGNAWQHSWFVLHEPENFINLHGGSEKFTQKLEQLFTESSEITGENVSADISGLIGQYAHGNEPSHHIAYLFNKAGKPWRTQFWVREILKTQYSTQPDGLSGNEDAGQMSAWYVFSSMGLYPFNPASAEYEIGSPIFEKSTINLGNGKHFKIIANNVSEENIYIQSATLNGKNFNSTSISHKQLLAGGELVFEMGSAPNKKWGVTTNTN